MRECEGGRDKIREKTEMRGIRMIEETFDE